jgi:hypothetical protein
MISSDFILFRTKLAYFHIILIWRCVLLQIKYLALPFTTITVSWMSTSYYMHSSRIVKFYCRYKMWLQIKTIDLYESNREFLYFARSDTSLNLIHNWDERRHIVSIARMPTDENSRGRDSINFYSFIQTLLLTNST